MFEPNYNFGFEVEKTIGLKVKAETPIPGLSFSLSAYTGDDETNLPIFQPDTRDVLTLSADYSGARVRFAERALLVELFGNLQEYLPPCNAGGARRFHHLFQ